MTKFLIKCMGYYDGINHECDTAYEHWGNWNDEELKAHEGVETDLELTELNYQWKGFERVDIYKLKDKNGCI